MKRYDELVLNLLLDKYENSLLYEEKNKVNISIFIPVNKHTLSDYFDVTSTAYDTIHEQLKELEAKGYLSLVWGKRKKHILEKCVLNTENAPMIYSLLHRVPKRQKEEGIILLCERLEQEITAEICSRFIRWIKERIRNKESVKEYVSLEEPKEFERLVRLLSAIENNKEELFLRQLSILVFHDSKVAEQEIRKAAGILERFREENVKQERREVNEEAVLAEYQIFRNPSWVMVKGTGVFTMDPDEKHGTAIDLSMFPGGLGISNEDMDKIRWMKSSRPKYVLTIENLTSFHQWKAKDGGLCIYLGGYANMPRRQMLLDLHKTFQGLDFFHFGDLDCGGFLIWKNLCEATKISILTKGMDLSTYEAYLPYGRELTAHDRKQLAQMMEDPFFEEQKDLFEQMLLRGRKLEQECIALALGE